MDKRTLLLSICSSLGQWGCLPLFCSGTCQECPHSPIIFILWLEPLLCRIRAQPDVKGLECGRDSHKVVTYAGDLLFFVTQPETTIPNLLQGLRQYTALSNYKINAGKSKAVNVPQSRLSFIQANFLFYSGSLQSQVFRGLYYSVHYCCF